MKTQDIESIESELLESTAKNKHMRRLSAAELKSAQIIYGQEVDFSKVELVPHRFDLFKDRPFTMRNRIHIPEAWYMDDFWAFQGSPTLVWYYRTIVIHELGHVWQYQTPRLNYHWIRALFESLRYGEDVYKYDIKEHQCLSDFRFEQQAQILQDYSHYVLRYELRLPSYRDVINCEIPQPEGMLKEVDTFAELLPYGKIDLRSPSA